jgi:hypothetical protein
MFETKKHTDSAQIESLLISFVSVLRIGVSPRRVVKNTKELFRIFFPKGWYKRILAFEVNKAITLRGVCIRTTEHHFPQKVSREREYAVATNQMKRLDVMVV